MKQQQSAGVQDAKQECTDQNKMLNKSGYCSNCKKQTLWVRQTPHRGSMKAFICTERGCYHTSDKPENEAEPDKPNPYMDTYRKLIRSFK